jgi:hypothetical protein
MPNAIQPEAARGRDARRSWLHPSNATNEYELPDHDGDERAVLDVDERARRTNRIDVRHEQCADPQAITPPAPYPSVNGAKRAAISG